MRAACQNKGMIRHAVGKGVAGSHITDEKFLCLYWMTIFVDPRYRY